jgi:1,4-dihydroxy-2-naphthoate octaprenyltransferase
VDADSSSRAGLGIWLSAARPRTLGASTVPVAVGLAMAARAGSIDAIVAVVTAVCAVLLQVGANFANDYFDWKSGVDTSTRLGPVRATAAGLVRPQSMRRALILVLACALACGMYLVAAGGWPIAAIGLASVIAAVAYSAGPFPLAWYGLGELLVFLFFGVIAVSGTYYLQRGDVSVETLLACLPPSALATALLVVNNLRDIDTDRAAGKRTVAVRIDARATRIEYALLVAAAFVAVVAVAVVIEPFAAIALLAAPLAVAEVQRLRDAQGASLNASLAGTARLHLVVGALFVLGLVLGVGSGLGLGLPT